MYHKTIITGNLGRDPEMRYTPGGDPVTSFSVAASNKKDETVWFRVSVWGKQAESCSQYLKKGSKVLVEGALKADDSGNPRIWHKDDGTAAASFELTAHNVRFLSGKDDGVKSDYDETVPF